MTGRADVEAANPATGEVLERLGEQPGEKLCEALDAVRARADECKRWDAALATELRRRLRESDRRTATFGDWEVEVPRGRESEWDAEQLREVVEGLMADGTVQLSDVADVIVQPPPQVARAEATRLASRLTGQAHDAVVACREWKDKPGRLTVTRSVQLFDADASAVEETSPPADPLPGGDGATALDTAAPARSPEPRAQAPQPALSHEELFA
jgi:hypothetical protein